MAGCAALILPSLQPGDARASQAVRRGSSTLRPLSTQGQNMDRRRFLASGPIAMAHAAASATSREFAPPLNPQLRTLLESAECAFTKARDLVHWPRRYPEASPVLANALEAVAQVWLRSRGISLPQPHYTWLHAAQDRRDEITGIPWRCAQQAMLRVRWHCDPLAQFFGHRDFTGPTKTGLIGTANAALSVGLELVACCIEAVRCEVLHHVCVADGRFLPSARVKARLADL